jgi:hypothetical protein
MKSSHILKPDRSTKAMYKGKFESHSTPRQGISLILSPHHFPVCLGTNLCIYGQQGQSGLLRQMVQMSVLYAYHFSKGGKAGENVRVQSLACSWKPAWSVMYCLATTPSCTPLPVGFSGRCDRAASKFAVDVTLAKGKCAEIGCHEPGQQRWRDVF